jgi:Ca2+-binding EF-hand superfamily protein
MAKNFDLLQLEVNTLKGREALSEAHSHMSQWFCVAWDQNHSGFIDWHEFSNGWIIATQGGDNEVCSLLFNAIDRDNDKYISSKDVIEYCRLALSNVQTISHLAIETTVKIIFDQMNRAGPFDVINIQEFTQYTQQHQESLFGTWTRVLQWKKTSSPACSTLLNGMPIPADYSPPIKVRRTRKEIQRSKTTGYQAEDNIILPKPSENRFSPDKIIFENDTNVKNPIRLQMKDQNFDENLTVLEDD